MTCKDINNVLDAIHFDFKNVCLLKSGQISCYIIVFFWCIEKSNPLSGKDKQELLAVLLDCEMKLCIIGTVWYLRCFRTAPPIGQKFKENDSCL